MKNEEETQLVGFVQYPNWIAQDPSMSIKAKAVLMSLLSRVEPNKTSTKQPHEILARDSSVSVSTVKLALKELRERGIVSWSKPSADALGRKGNTYKIHILEK